MGTREYKEGLLESLRDPEEASDYLSGAFEDGDPEVILLAIRDVVEAQGGIGQVSKKANLNRESLYRGLSENGNPKLKSLCQLFKAMGFSLSVQPHGT
ncbi:MAG: putative addiction module antidote protein [Magnetococcales bacterium]|nr:putative addiction module antidote protein [Magnetococcales bacterium]